MNRLRLKVRPLAGYPMSIGQAAVTLGVSASTLRVYERMGIVNPERAGSKQERFYLPDDIEKIRKYRESRVR